VKLSPLGPESLTATTVNVSSGSVTLPCSNNVCAAVKTLKNSSCVDVLTLILTRGVSMLMLSSIV
jgi:hypothetical protein